MNKLLLIFSSVRKGLASLVGAQIVFGHGNQDGSHGQLTDQMQTNSILSPRVIADSYDEAIIPLGNNRNEFYLIELTLFF